MSGFKIVLPTTFSNQSLPILGDDPILSKGSLVLVEPGHPVNPLVGVPDDGTLLPNLAFQQATALVGGYVTGAQLAAPYVKPSAGALWRTSKGALQWSTAGGNAAGGALLPLKVLQHIEKYPDHVRYVSWWGGYVSGTGINGQLTYATLNSDGAPDNGAWSLTGGAGGGNAQLGPRRGSVAQAYQGTRNATAAATHGMAKIFGRIMPNPTPSNGQMIFTRFYLEDLTISGRTEAEVQAIDSELFARNVLTPGGRYYGERYVEM